ncbi:InlB B-repeat-containing protein, partial [Dorea formicigenerans]
MKKVDGYVSMNVIRVGSWSSGSNWTTIQQTNPVQKFRYKGGSVQYTTNGTNWVNVNSWDSIIAFYGIKRTAALDETDVGVVIGDWPYGDNDGYGHNKHTIRIQMVVDGSGTEIYNSGKMRYDNNQNQALGKIEFNCDESRYEIKKIYVYSNDAGTGSPVKTYDAVPAGGISVKFDTQQENHYLVKAVVKPKEFTVSYDINGGTGDVPATTKLTAVNNQQVTVASSPQPTKEKYIFAGWEYNGTTYYGGESFEMPPRNVTFRAKWIPEAEMITYHSNNEEWGTVNRKYENLKAGASETRGSIAKAADGCIFEGWKNDTTGEIVSKDVNYKPEVKAGSYTAVFKANISKYLKLETKDVTETYNGENHASGTAVVKGKTKDANLTGVKIYYQNTKGGDWVTDPSKITAKNVEDSTTVKVKVISDEYSGELTGEEKLTITPATITVTANNASKKY